MEVRVSSVMSLVAEQIEPSAMQPGTWVVGLADIESHTGQWTAIRSNCEVPKSSKFVFEIGDILFGKLRPELRKCVVANGTGVCSTDLIVLRPKNPADAWYLNLMLRSDSFIGQVRRRTVGASLPRIRPSDLLNCTLPWPAADIRNSYGERARLLSALREHIREVNDTLSTIERRLQSPE